jgi:hypothetical protein
MTGHDPRRTSLRRPPRLHAGDRVALLTVSSTSNLERIDEGIDVLRFCGLEPVEYPTARARASAQPFLAGTDAERAADLRAALLDDSIAGVMTVGGGYGSQRMLEVLDWSGLDAVSPKVVVGYSDVTGLLEALASRLGWSSVMGPMVSEGEFRESYSFSSLWSCLASPERYGPLAFPDAATLGRSSCSRTRTRTPPASTRCSPICAAAGTSPTRPGWSRGSSPTRGTPLPRRSAPSSVTASATSASRSSPEPTSATVVTCRPGRSAYAAGWTPTRRR